MYLKIFIAENSGSCYIFTELAFHGQSCGVIVAETMALTHSASAHVEAMRN